VTVIFLFIKTVTHWMQCVIQNKGRQRPTAKATLYGLSSIRREGDVTVNMMSSHTTVRTKFTVGPLILKVEKEVSKN
jgi:methylglutaconyl-CoA hydratase